VYLCNTPYQFPIWGEYLNSPRPRCSAPCPRSTKWIPQLWKSVTCSSRSGFGQRKRYLTQEYRYIHLLPRLRHILNRVGGVGRAQAVFPPAVAPERLPSLWRIALTLVYLCRTQVEHRDRNCRQSLGEGERRKPRPCLLNEQGRKHHRLVLPASKGHVSTDASAGCLHGAVCRR
jgi:hypothetical protein